MDTKPIEATKESKGEIFHTTTLEPVDDAKITRTSDEGDTREMFPLDIPEETSAADAGDIPLSVDSKTESVGSELGRGLDEGEDRIFASSEMDPEPSDTVDGIVSSIESDAEPVQAEGETLPYMTSDDEILPSIETDATPSEADAQDLGVSKAFVSSLENLQVHVEEWAWTRDQIVPRLPDDVVQQHLLTMTRAALNALNTFSEPDDVEDEDECPGSTCRTRGDTIVELHGLLSQVFTTYEVHLSIWLESGRDDEQVNSPRTTRAATVDAEDGEMKFAMDMLRKNDTLGMEKERLERRVSRLEMDNHKLKIQEEESRLELQTMAREMASCSPSRKMERELRGGEAVEVVGLWPGAGQTEEASSLHTDDNDNIYDADDTSEPPYSSPNSSPKVKWCTPSQGLTPKPPAKRPDWRRKFWSEQTRALAAERSRQECDKELEDVRWEVKGLRRELKASQCREEQLDRRLKQRVPTESSDDREAAPWHPPGPRTLFSELGSLASSPLQGCGSRPASLAVGLDVVGVRRTGGSPALMASFLVREEYTAWRDVFCLVCFVCQWIFWLLTCFLIRIRGLVSLPGVRRENWRPVARPEASFRTDGLVRALRQVMLILSLHSYLACRTERELWLVANSQTGRYLRREMRYGRPPWIVPGVDPGLLWERMTELFGPVMAQTVDVWLPLVLGWWRGELEEA
ncbi:hypothetical protein GQ602_003492 [Ophiocordyceps camponoti-floridani]|uniref:Uncharacterized protein n=1 Tax=Ophiocordyceps camponoti-floridani TaxID=2030778 RepID=A0A8H4VE94_9HYPO|nr:hypothetical protein GQ602_003492 [Ophiocordyceps camponoti-floridani]